MLPAEILEVFFYLGHLLLHIPVGDNHLRALDESLLVVDSIQQNGEIGLHGDEIETLLPVGIRRTSALGSDAELELVHLLRLGCKIVGHAGVLRAPYGNAAPLPENGT